jgi:hypothetical protein
MLGKLRARLRKMPGKLADKVKKFNLILPMKLVRRVNAYRGTYEEDMPSASQAMRDLIELGLDAVDAGWKPKPKKEGHQ